ncbi:uncharacterized protein LOC127796657 [Diospyros lotus]|uniref:uncharacterized protein LOC127796657 n=1 Tax=Diospyros lotus TaxID=55363 RepID=UPI00225AB0A9|nr:uncharacterized protein LOC127796657 [Diospyros lotus]
MAHSEAQVGTAEVMASEGGGRRSNPNTNRNPNPIASLLSMLNISNLFPPPKRDANKAEPPARPLGGGDSNEAKQEEKPVVVKVPRPQTELPSLKLEAEGSEQNTNPIVLWQVYAIGGFFVLKWVLARWNERSKKRSSDEEPSPGDD